MPSFFLAFALNFIVIHQYGLFSLVQDQHEALKDPNSAVSKMLVNMMSQYGHSFRTFKHGALHGAIAGVTFATPIVAINALFERKSFKYVAINAGFWILSCILMGAFICHFQTVAHA